MHLPGRCHHRHHVSGIRAEREASSITFQHDSVFSVNILCKVPDLDRRILGSRSNHGVNVRTEIEILEQLHDLVACLAMVMMTSLAGIQIRFFCSTLCWPIIMRGQQIPPSW